MPQQSIQAELQALASRASTIFVGQILSVERQAAFVAITFRVDQPVAGSAGDTFVLHEWTGQWPVGHQRYAPGLRALVFVQGGSRAGLSSPVDGATGLVPVVVQGANAPLLLNTQRLAAEVLRAPGTPLPVGKAALLPLGEALPWITKSGVAGRLSPLPRRVPASVGWQPVQGDPAPSGNLPTLDGATVSNAAKDGEATHVLQ